jgi:hypothetical protein
MKLLTHQRRHDSNPLRDDFIFDDGNFYRRVSPREIRREQVKTPPEWLESTGHTIHGYYPVANPNKVKDLETAYQQWASPTNPERQTCKPMATPTLDPQQIQQLIEAIQQLSAKLDALSVVDHTVDKITDSILTYSLLFPKI